MEKLSDYFEFNIICFKLSGIWIDLRELRNTPLAITIYSFVVNTMFIILPQVCHVIFMYKARDNIQAFAEEFYVSLSSIMVVFKSYSLLKDFKIVRNLLNTMDTDMFQPKNTDQINQVQKVMGTWKKYQFLYIYLAGSFIFLQLITPLVNTITHNVRILPLVDCYPFDVYTTPSYEFTYLYQTFVLITLVAQNVNLDTLITGLMTVAALQCDIMCNDLNNLKMEQMADSNDKIKEMDDKLIGCIKHHKEIQRFVTDVSDCFSLSMFQQCFCSVITFCTTMFELSVVEPLSQNFFTVIFYQLSVFFQVFLFCWAGTELTEKSKNIPIAAYQSDWCDASKSFRSNLLIFIHRTQRYFEIKGFIIPICVDTFVQIVKSSFSYYTVLVTLDEK